MYDASDSGLVGRAQGGDVDAIGTLYDQHHESIFRYLWLRLGDRQVAEDLTGDVFMRMLTALPHYRSVGLPFRAWLYRIAHNLLVDHFRKTNNPVLIPLDEINEQSDESDPASATEQRLFVVRMNYALSKLDENQREVIVLRFVLGLPLREVTLAMGKTEAAVKSLQHRGLVALRLVLSQEQEQVIK